MTKELVDFKLKDLYERVLKLEKEVKELKSTNRTRQVIDKPRYKESGDK